MKSEEAYSIWAPSDSAWSQWAKPTLFAQTANIEVVEGVTKWHSIDTSAVPAPQADTALIIDLPGPDSTDWGLALAQRGYRPVPLYNACLYPGIDRSKALVDVTPILEAVKWGTLPLQRMQIAPNAAPAFLLDADRCRNRFPTGGRFDNRWVVFPQDFPSANFLLSRGIRRVILVQEDDKSQIDLAHVLLRWQEAGIRILVLPFLATGPPREITVAKPSGFRTLLYRALALMGLRRNSAGGFGSIVPEPSAGGAGYG
jgi:hypothetical protein